MAETSLLNEGTSFAQSSKPIVREGFASCIRCGNTGVKDTFYGRGKQYCSTNCVKGQTPVQPSNNNLIYQKLNTNTAPSTIFKLPQQFNHHQSTTSSNLQKVNQSFSKLNFQTTTHQSNKSIKEELNQDNDNNNMPNSATGKDIKNKAKTNGKLNQNAATNLTNCESQSTSRFKTSSFDWCVLLNRDSNFKAAPVSSFKHVPSADVCGQFAVNNLKIEFRNKDAQLPSDVKNPNDVYWIASVIRVEGYYLCLRWEGYEKDSSADFWASVINPLIHPVGWSAQQRKHLMPPKSIVDRQSDWKTYLTKCLIGANTLPHNFVDQIRECLKSNFRVGMKLEVVDKSRISSVRPATIHKIIGGRLHVIYDGLEDKDSGFWCHQQSNLIHPVGWAQLIGHELRSTSEYALSSLNKARNGKWAENDADFSYFPHLSKQMVNGNLHLREKFQKGMKLEAVDPLNLSTICCATVTKVLRFNYIMVGIDGMMAKDGSDWFCYHASSSNIFPVGTCNLNKLTLTPPRDYSKPFNWFQYLKECKAEAAPVSLFNNEQPLHGFKKGMYLEAVDLMEPRLICVAMVKEVVGRLLKIHFNGWDSSFDQWVDSESVELFPVGWCEIVGYPLEPPREDSDQSSAGPTALNSFVFDSTIKKRSKQPYKGGRSKKRKRNHLSSSDKLTNGSNVKDDESIEMMADEQDNCSIFNSTVENVDNKPTETVASERNQDEDEFLTRNSTVTFKPSPLLNNNHKVNSNQPETPINEWSVQDVVNYFKSNGYTNYSESFSKHGIDGDKLIRLTREDILRLTENKLGPSLRIKALIDELKKCTN